VTEALISLSDVDLKLGSGANAVHVLKSVSLDIAEGSRSALSGRPVPARQRC
jgi:putative ABC transport system ATP-binding protein